jgi:hypothetical protein
LSQLNYCPNLNFTCDKCGREYEKKIAYTPASSLKELEYKPTYCIDCVDIKEKNKYTFNIDGRSLNKSGRVYQLGTRVKKEFLEKLKRIASEEGLKLVEVLEKSLECYERSKK